LTLISLKKQDARACSAVLKELPPLCGQHKVGQFDGKWCRIIGSQANGSHREEGKLPQNGREDKNSRFNQRGNLSLNKLTIRLNRQCTNWE